MSSVWFIPHSRPKPASTLPAVGWQLRTCARPCSLIDFDHSCVGGQIYLYWKMCLASASCHLPEAWHDSQSDGLQKGRLLQNNKLHLARDANNKPSKYKTLVNLQSQSC